MNSTNDNVFNPGEFTDRELLKLVYRELHALKEEFSEYKRSNMMAQESVNRMNLEIEQLRGEIATLQALRIENEKKIQRLISVGGIVLLGLQIIVNIIINVVMKK
jgi:hypothetical protein